MDVTALLCAERAVPGAQGLTHACRLQHAAVDQLIGQIEHMPPDDSAYVPAMQRLRRLVQRHLQDEETEMFPKVAAALDQDRLDAMGARVAETNAATRS